MWLYEKDTLKISTILPDLVVIVLVLVKNNGLYCHVILYDQVTKGLFKFMVSSPSRKVNIIPILVTMGIVVVDA